MRMEHIFRLFFLVLSVTLFVSDGSAANVPMGSWNADTTTKQSIESGKLLPNHTYYYSGSMSSPDCFIAIDNQYTLRKSPVWAKAEEMSEKVLKGWLQSFKTQGMESSSIGGGVILTPDGKKAGVFYSHYPVNIVQMPEPGILEIFQPHPVGGQKAGQGS